MIVTWFHPNDRLGSRRLTARPATRRAAAAVEFAFVAPVVIMLVLGSIEFGRAMMVLNLLGNAARNGARAGALPGNDNTAITSAVDSLLNSSGISSGSATITVQVNGTTQNASTAGTGDAVSVTVSISASAVSWLPTATILGSSSLQQSSIMRRE